MSAVVVTVPVISRHPFSEMRRVELEPRHLKRYPHFDSPLEMSEALELVNDPKAVEQHAFYPFIVVRKGYQPFRNPRSGKGRSKPRPKLKERLLRSAARRDAAIYAAYRALLAPLYDQHLEEAGIGDSVIAYRSIRRSDDDRRGKSNIHHANEVFRDVASRGNCVAVALDITSFFESIDHSKLKRLWSQVLGTDSLPGDHYKVFKNITRYSQVEHEELYLALGLTRTVVRKGKSFEIPLRRNGRKDKKRSLVGRERAGSVTVSQKKSVPLQLCTPDVFRKTVCGEALGATSLISTNQFEYGIPQGSPISDLLANISLFEFDKEMYALAARLGGIYRRYSDDMLFVIDGGLPEGESVRETVIASIKAHGSELKIKPSKTSVVAFVNEGTRQRATCSAADERQVDGLEYLGFRYDGSRVFFRQGTVSRLQRRINQRVRREAIVCARRYPQLSFTELEKRFRVSEVLTAVDRVPRKDRFGEQRKDTFYGYARRATQIFGDSWGRGLLEQAPCRRWVAEAKSQYFSTPANAECQCSP